MSAKTVTRWQITQTAAKEVGYTETGGRDGRSGNITKYWAARYPAWQGQPWCGAFVDWVLARHRVDGYPIGRNGIFYTPSIVAAAKSKGVWRTNLAGAQPGDIVLFNFGSGGAKHVGFVEKYLGSGRVQTIEGNTSSGNVGSQNDGGGVYRRTRTGSTIMGYVDMSKWLAKNAADLKGAKPKAKPKPKSWFDTATTADLREAVDAAWSEVVNVPSEKTRKTKNQLLIYHFTRGGQAARDAAKTLAVQRSVAVGAGLTLAQVADIEAKVDALIKEE